MQRGEKRERLRQLLECFDPGLPDLGGGLVLGGNRGGGEQAVHRFCRQGQGDGVTGYEQCRGGQNRPPDGRRRDAVPRLRAEGDAVQRSRKKNRPLATPEEFDRDVEIVCGQGDRSVTRFADRWASLSSEPPAGSSSQAMSRAASGASFVRQVGKCQRQRVHQLALAINSFIVLTSDLTAVDALVESGLLLRDRASSSTIFSTPPRTQDDRHADVVAADAVFLVAVGGTGNQPLLVADDRLDHLRRGRGRGVVRAAGLEQPTISAPPLRARSHDRVRASLRSAAA